MALGRILKDEQDEGSGFVLATMLGEPSRVALTAYHVIRNAQASSIRFVTEEGRTTAVERVEQDKDLDIAVLHLKEGVSEGLAVGHAVKGAAWEVKTRPLPNDPQLNGIIDALDRRITNDQGYEVEAMQLRENHSLDEYEGYSGSPVELESPQRAVIGVLSEEVRSRFLGNEPGLPRASNVLYAIPIDHVLERFGLTAVLADPPPDVRPPDPPAHPVDRMKQLDPLKEDLLRDATKELTGGRRIALVGMGGAGKTVAAAQLARDPDVRRAFPHGVIWIQLGKAPLVTSQAQLAAALGDNGQAFKDHLSGRAHLRRLLADRACLVVLDNVSKRDELEAFDTLGPRSRSLFTTRFKDLADSYSGSTHRVGLLSPDQARALLAGWAGVDTNALPHEASSILEECGGLPLAIAMAGAMVRRRPERWSSLPVKFEKARIERIHALLPGYDHPNLLAALDVGVEDLDTAGRERGLRDARNRYLDLAVFAGRGAAPRSTLAALWASANIEYDEVEDYADLFVDRSLATWDTAEERLRLHDLQMDYVANRSREQLSELHARLVDGYAHHSSGGWASGPDDGYYYQNLPHHLAKADRDQELRELLSDITWIRAKLAAAGIIPLVADYDIVSDDASLQRVGETLRLSAGALTWDSGLLEGQLLGRLADSDDPTIRHLLEVATRSRAGTWLQPHTRSLARPGGLLRRVLRLPSGLEGGAEGDVRFSGATVSADGHVAVCQALHIRPGASKADSKVLVWDLHSLEEPHELQPPHPMGHLAVTSNGRLAAFAAGPWDLDLVDLESGVLIDQTRIKLNPTTIAVADDPLRVVVGHLDGWVACWEPGVGTAHTAQVFSHEHVRAVAISADGSTAVAMSNYGSLVRLPLPEMRPAQALGNHYGAFALALSPDGRLATTGGHDRSLNIWHLEHAQSDVPTQVLAPQDSRIQAISITQGNNLVVSLEDGTIQLWDPTNGQMLASAGLDLSIMDQTVSRDGRTAIAREGEERVLVLDLSALDAEPSVANRGRPTAVAVTPDSRVAFSGSTRGVLTRIDIPSQPGLAQVRSRIVATFTNESGRFSFSGDWTGTISVCDVRDRPPHEWLHPWWPDITRLGVTPDGRRVVWASSDGVVTVWEGADRPPYSATWGGGMWISSIVATPNGLAAIHKDGKISYGDVEQGEWGQWNLWDGSYDSRRRVSCAAAPDERSRVLGTRDGLLILEERGGSSSRVEAHKASVETVAITPDGAVVVSGAADGTIAVLRPRLSLNSQLILGHRDPVRVLALDPSGNFAVSGSAADDLTVWRLPELTRVAGFHCDGKIEDIALAAGASFVVIADGAGSVHLLSKMQGSEALEPASTSHGPQPV